MQSGALGSADKTADGRVQLFLESLDREYRSLVEAHEKFTESIAQLRSAYGSYLEALVDGPEHLFEIQRLLYSHEYHKKIFSMHNGGCGDWLRCPKAEEAQERLDFAKSEVDLVVGLDKVLMVGLESWWTLSSVYTKQRIIYMTASRYFVSASSFQHVVYLSAQMASSLR